MLNIDIWDVGHGACAVLAYPNGTRIMVDVGHRSDPFWSPSIEYYGQRMALLLLQNLDEDHVANLPWVLRNMAFQSLRSNPTVTAEALASMKRDGGMREGVKAAHGLLRQYGATYGPGIDLGPLGWGRYWWNRYGVDFTITNDLSMPAFFGYGPFTILFGGDLETDGWLALLRFPEFKQMLTRVNVFVASHHGRDNGRCDEVFKWCCPDIVIMSDYDHRHQTQQTTDWYRYRTKGIVDNTVGWTLGGPQKRYVMTTRNDGSLKIVVRPDGGYTVIPERLQTQEPVLPMGLLSAMR